MKLQLFLVHQNIKFKEILLITNVSTNFTLLYYYSFDGCNWIENQLICFFLQTRVCTKYLIKNTRYKEIYWLPTLTPALLFFATLSRAVIVFKIKWFVFVRLYCIYCSMRMTATTRTNASSDSSSSFSWKT